MFQIIGQERLLKKIMKLLIISFLWIVATKGDTGLVLIAILTLGLFRDVKRMAPKTTKGKLLMLASFDDNASPNSVIEDPYYVS